MRSRCSVVCATWSAALLVAGLYVIPALHIVPALDCGTALAASEDARRPGHKSPPAKWGTIPTVNTTGGVRDFKAIKEFTIPAHWEGGSGHRLSRDAYEFRWNREGETNVEMKVRVVTRSMSDAARQKFKAILATKPHRLTGAEIKSVEAALRPPASPSGFRELSGAHQLEIDSAETRDIDGVRVLCFVSGLDGFGSQPQDVVLVPLDETFSNCQEVLYSAAKSKFETYRKEAHGALAALRLQRD